MNDAERNKLIARMMKEGASDDQIRAALAREDSLMGWFRRTTAKGQAFENSLKKPTKPSTPSPTMDRLKNVALGGLQKVSEALETGAEYAKNRKDNPIDSIKSGTFTQDMLGAGYNVGKVGLNALDRVMGPVTALDSGVGEVLKESNPLKTPYAFVKGYAQNVLKPSSEQSTVSEATGATGMSGLVQDFMVPSTFLGGGFLKALKGGQKLTQAAKAGAKNIGKATLMGGAAARAVSEADDPGAAVPLAVAGAIKGIKGKRPIMVGQTSDFVRQEINKILDKYPRLASTIHAIDFTDQGLSPKGRGNAAPIVDRAALDRAIVATPKGATYKPDGNVQGTLIKLRPGRDDYDTIKTFLHELTHGAQNAFAGGKPVVKNNVEIAKADVRSQMRHIFPQQDTIPYKLQPIEVGARATAQKKFSELYNKLPRQKYSKILRGQLTGEGGDFNAGSMRQAFDKLTHPYLREFDTVGELGDLLSTATTKEQRDSFDAVDFLRRFKKDAKSAKDLEMGDDLDGLWGAANDISGESPNVPAPYFSQLEREIEALGKKPMSMMDIARKLKSRFGGADGIKPDEWRDVGMEDILATKAQWTPQELLQAVRENRPYLDFKESLDWKNFSTARVPGNVTVDTPIDQTGGYKSIRLRQPGVSFKSLHFPDDTVANLRLDVVGGPPDNVRNDYYTWKEILEDPRTTPEMREEILTQHFPEVERQMAEAPKKATIVNEGQSDVHQASNKKLYPEPPKPETPEWPIDVPKPDSTYVSAWDKWNMLTPEQKRQRVGYRSQGDTAKAKRYNEILDRSAFGAGRPSRSKSVRDYRDKLRDKEDTLASRESWGLRTSPVNSRAVQEDMRIDTPYRKPHPDLRIGYNADRTMVDESDAWETLLNKRSRGADDATIEKLTEAARRTPHEVVAEKARALLDQPDPKTVGQKSWPLMLMKQALIEAVQNGSDRLGVLDSEGIARVLQDETDRPFRNRWQDSELPGLLESFLRGQGITNAKFGEKEAFSHGLNKESFQARFMEITPEIRALVKKGIPLYMAIAMVNGNKQYEQ